MKHTATPWHFTIEKTVYFIETDSYVIARIYDEHDEDHENARFIVRAVNCHAELLEALEYIVNDVPAPGEDARLTAEGYNKACEAIRKATEGEK